MRPAASRPAVGRAALRLGRFAVVALAVAGCSPAAANPTGGGTAAASAPRSPTPSGTPSARYPVGLERYAPSARRPLPAIAGATLAGPPASTAALRGHVVVLNVWASWCAPCRQESRVLAALATGPEPGVRWLGMDENDPAPSARSFLRAAGYPPPATYPEITDDGSRLAALGGWLPPALPGTLVVDPQGRVAARVVGAVTAGQLEPVLAELASH